MSYEQKLYQFMWTTSSFIAVL